MLLHIVFELDEFSIGTIRHLGFTWSLSLSPPIPPSSIRSSIKSRANSHRKSLVWSRYRIDGAVVWRRYIEPDILTIHRPWYRDPSTVQSIGMRTAQIVTASRGQTQATIIRVLNTGYIAALLLVLTPIWRYMFQEGNRRAISSTLMRFR